MVGDPLANFIISIKNAGVVGKESIAVPFSKMKHSIAVVLNKEGFVGEVGKKGEGVKKVLTVVLLYDKEGKPKIKDVARVSKFSKRIYIGSKEIKSVRGGTGLLVLSTPKGIMSGKEARKQNVGGEVLFKAW